MRTLDELQTAWGIEQLSNYLVALHSWVECFPDDKIPDSAFMELARKEPECYELFLRIWENEYQHNQRKDVQEVKPKAMFVRLAWLALWVIVGYLFVIYFAK